MPCWITKLWIRFQVSRDEDTVVYKNLLSQPQIGVSLFDIAFSNSNWMKLQILNYRTFVEKLINNKSIASLYRKIEDYYEKFKNTDAQPGCKKTEILADISNLQMKTEELLKIRDDYDNGAPLPVGVIARELNSDIKRVKEQYEQKQVDLNFIEREQEIVKNKWREKVKSLEFKYRKRIDLLDNKLRKRENKYNDQLGYYWDRFCSNLLDMANDNQQNFKISERAKRLEEIETTYGKETLFSKERQLINEKINQDLGIHFHV